VMQMDGHSVSVVSVLEAMQRDADGWPFSVCSVSVVSVLEAMQRDVDGHP
jgi:hypothetical protein